LVAAWKIILAAIVFMIISQVINTLEAYATMTYYTDPAYFIVWSNIMMPKKYTDKGWIPTINPGPPPMEFYYISWTFSFITGLFFVGVYSVITKCVPGNTVAKKGLIYGLLIWLVSGLPGNLAMVLLINLPVDLITYWTVTSLIINLLAGVAIAKIVK
jgi:hypothetical protein